MGSQLPYYSGEHAFAFWLPLMYCYELGHITSYSHEQTCNPGVKTKKWTPIQINGRLGDWCGRHVTSLPFSGPYASPLVDLLQTYWYNVIFCKMRLTFVSKKWLNKFLTHLNISNFIFSSSKCFLQIMAPINIFISKFSPY